MERILACWNFNDREGPGPPARTCARKDGLQWRAAEPCLTKIRRRALSARRARRNQSNSDRTKAPIRWRAAAFRGLFRNKDEQASCTKEAARGNQTTARTIDARGTNPCRAGSALGGVRCQRF